MVIPGSGRQFALNGGAEPWHEPEVAEPSAELDRLCLHEGRCVAADVLQQLDGDLAVTSLGPAADDPAVQPRGRSYIASPVEQCLLMAPEEPAAIQPAHHGRAGGGAGPTAASQRRASPARAIPAPAIPAPAIPARAIPARASPAP